MSHLAYHNNVVTMNELFFNSHKDLTVKICKYLGHEDKTNEILSLYLDKPDIRQRKILINQKDLNQHFYFSVMMRDQN